MRLITLIGIWLLVGVAGALYNYLFNLVGEHHQGMFVFFTVAPVMAFAASRKRGTV